jgi:hypothetical protein
MARQQFKTPLDKIEFYVPSDITKYAETMRDIGRGLEFELACSASELQAMLGNSGGTIYERAVAKMKARRVAARLKRASHLARGISVEGIKFYKTFQREFALALSPPKKSTKKTFDWKG